MNLVQLERIQSIVTTPQLQLFFRLSKMYGWLGELYLELILSQEEIEYIYRPTSNICYIAQKEKTKPPNYLMR
jgi:hypothetical protein